MEFKEEDKYLRAKRRMEELKGFYWHLFTFLLVLPILGVVNYLTTSYPWIIFPVMGWGIGLTIHWFVTFKRGSILGKNWEQRKIQEFMQEEENDQKQLYQ